MPPKSLVPKPTTDRAIEAKLNKIYYAPGGFVGADKLQQRLKDLGISYSKRKIQTWLSKQTSRQLLKPPKKIKNYHSFTSAGPNDKHVIDLAFMNTKSNGFNGFLVVIDVYSRFAAAKPISSKTAANIAEQYQNILDDGPLGFPRQVISDEGSEFKGAFAKLLEKHDSTQFRAIPGNHNTTSIVDGLIFNMKKRLTHEMNSTKHRNWDKMISPLIESYNNDIHYTTRMRPIEVITGKAVPIPEPKNIPEFTDIKKEPLIPNGTTVRIKLTEQKGINRNRATDSSYWSDGTYEIFKGSYSPSNLRYYKIRDKKAKKVLTSYFYQEEILPFERRLAGPKI